MALAEKRAIKAAQDRWLLLKQTEIRELSGGGVVFSIDGPSFDGDLKAIDSLEFNGAQQVCSTFHITGADALGSDAFRRLKNIVVKNVPQAEHKALSLSEGMVWP